MINETLTIQPSATANAFGASASYGPKPQFALSALVIGFPNGINAEETLSIVEDQAQCNGACENLITATVADADGLSFARCTMPLTTVSFKVQSSIADSAAVVAIQLIGHN
jgi:hypothetical protein